MLKHAGSGANSLTQEFRAGRSDENFPKNTFSGKKSRT